LCAEISGDGEDKVAVANAAANEKTIERILQKYSE
jgi:hypothetical protein